MTGYGKARDLRGVADLVPRMEGWLPGCPPVLLRQTLQDTARRFCMETGALRTEIGPFGFVDGQNVYLLELPVLATVLNVHGVWISGMKCHPTSYRIRRNEDTDTVIEFALVPAASEGRVWTAGVSMTPLMGCEEYPSAFMDKWGHAVVAGALALLMADSTKAYHNPVMAAENAAVYRVAAQGAVYERLASGTRDGRLTFQNDEHFAGGFY